MLQTLYKASAHLSLCMPLLRVNVLYNRGAIARVYAAILLEPGSEAELELVAGQLHGWMCIVADSCLQPAVECSLQKQGPHRTLS